jgi:hypothetical protein
VRAQLRPGVYLTWALATAGLVALVGGGLTSLVLLLLWGLSSGSSTAESAGSGGAAGKKGAGGKPAGGRASDEVSSEAGWSEVSSGARRSLPPRIALAGVHRMPPQCSSAGIICNSAGKACKRGICSAAVQDRHACAWASTCGAPG